jgi:hypothetical protein
MRSQFFILLILVCSAGSRLSAQSGRCATDEYFHQKSLQNPALLAREAAMKNLSGNGTRAGDTTTYTIPLVFHIIHMNGGENIVKLRVEQQVLTLNETFNKLNRDTQNVRPVFVPYIGKVKIKFVLAKRDPNGNCTDGITRHESEMTFEAHDNVKEIVQWDPKKYLNIWVVNSIENFTGQPGEIAGFATFPWDAAAEPQLDGIVADYNYVGRSYKVLTHEIGHYLGLMHPFSDGCFTGDGVGDTPPVGEANYGWNINTNSCHNDNPDLPDMIENYMDYADHSYMFTKGQADRARLYLTQYRSNLVSAANVSYLTSPCTTSLEETEDALAGLQLYPNPSAGQVKLVMPGRIRENLSITLFEPGGRKLMHQQFSGTVGEVSLDLSNMSVKQGLYFVRVESASGVQTLKLMVK